MSEYFRLHRKLVGSQVRALRGEKGGEIQLFYRRIYFATDLLGNCSCWRFAFAVQQKM